MVWIIIIIALILLYILLSFLFFIFITNVKIPGPYKLINNKIEEVIKPYKNIYEDAAKWLRSKPKKEVNIKSKDGLRLHGIMLENPKAKGVILLAHGYRSTKERDVYAGAKNYYNMGLSILFIDQRCCGKSEGKYITFGVKESEDINEWIKYLRKNYKNKNIFLGGISLGATSVLLVNNPHVKAIVADSGFTSGWDEIKYCLKHYFYLPGFLFMPMINVFAKKIAKYNLKAKKTFDNLSKLNIPILFIHGNADDFVPTDNCVKNYEHYKGPKEILIIDGAQHGMSFLIDPETYLKTIKEFLKDYL